ncbi:MAG: archaeosine biosynthesis radical SAM protein RaSEA [Methanomassiliicoccales archaeon]
MPTNSRITPLAVWKEEDVIEGRRVKAFVTILRTTGCWWSRERGCTMCGYNLASEEHIGLQELRMQLEKVLTSYSGEEMVKIYNSGSFLDPREIPLEFRQDILNKFEKARRILFETRPEFVTEETLNQFPADRISVAIGLESGNDDVLKSCIRKGLTVDQYVTAAKLLNRKRIPLRTYLLLKPPFLTERQAVEDAKRSASFASRLSESVSINPLNVQKGTLVEELWRRGDYRPPWLWSLVEVLKSRKGCNESRIFSSPSGGGTPRGIHNCANCDRKVLEAIQRFTFSQDQSEFDQARCGCAVEWKALMDVQDAMSTSVDTERYLGSELDLE